MWYGKNDNRQDEAACDCRINSVTQKELIDRALTSYARLIRFAELQELENMFFESLEKSSLSETKSNISGAIKRVLGTK